MDLIRRKIPVLGSTAPLEISEATGFRRSQFIAGASALGLMAALGRSPARAGGYTVRQWSNGQGIAILDSNNNVVMQAGWQSNQMMAWGQGLSGSLPLQPTVGQTYKPFSSGPSMKYASSGHWQNSDGSYFTGIAQQTAFGNTTYGNQPVCSPTWHLNPNKGCQKPPCPQDEVDCMNAMTAEWSAFGVLVSTLPGLFAPPPIDVAVLIAALAEMLVLIITAINAMYQCGFLADF